MYCIWIKIIWSPALCLFLFSPGPCVPRTPLVTECYVPRLCDRHVTMSQNFLVSLRLWGLERNKSDGTPWHSQGPVSRAGRDDVSKNWSECDDCDDWLTRKLSQTHHSNSEQRGKGMPYTSGYLHFYYNSDIITPRFPEHNFFKLSYVDGVWTKIFVANIESKQYLVIQMIMT